MANRDGRLTATAIAQPSETEGPPLCCFPRSLFVCHDGLGMTALLGFHWTLFGGNHDRIRHLCICPRRRYYNSILAGRPGHPTDPPSSLPRYVRHCRRGNEHCEPLFMK